MCDDAGEDDNRRSPDSNVGSATAPGPGLSDANILRHCAMQSQLLTVDDTSSVLSVHEQSIFQNACAWRNKKATEVASLLSLDSLLLHDLNIILDRHYTLGVFRYRCRL